jgi:kinesin family protein 6/9
MSAQVHEENKEMLRVKYEKAKSLGAAVNESKTRIEELKVGVM